MEITFLNQTEQIHSLIQQFRFRDALLILSHLLFTEPEKPIWYGFRTIIASEMHRKVELIELHKLIMKYYPNTSQALMAKALLPGADIEEAESALQFACELEPSNPYLYYLLGKNYRMQGYLDQAVKYFSRCLKLDRYFVLAYLLRADCYSRLYSHQNAFRDYHACWCLSSRANQKQLKASMVRELKAVVKTGDHIPEKITEEDVDIFFSFY
jgi:tetratricopeptide (TPR) repeat protein